MVGGLAIAFAAGDGRAARRRALLRPGRVRRAVRSAATLSVSTLALLLLFKGLAWSISLGSFRGGPTFPALFLGVVGGLIAAHLPGYDETQAVAALSARRASSMLRLPLASVMIASLLRRRPGSQ